MGARQGDQRLPGAPRHANDVAAQAVSVVVLLSWHLLGRRNDPLGALRLATHADHDEPAGVGPGVTLDHAADDLAFTRGELAKLVLVLRVTPPCWNTCRAVVAAMRPNPSGVASHSVMRLPS